MKYIPGSETPLPPDIDRMVRSDKLKLLYHQSVPAVFIALAAAVLLGWMLWGHTRAGAIEAWVGLLAVSSGVRVVVFLGCFRAERLGLDLLKWELPYFVTLIVSALVWGVGALVVMPAESLFHQAVTLFALLGMAGGALSTYSARRPMAVGSMLATLLPGTIWLFLQPGREQVGMAIGSAMFMVAALRATTVMEAALDSSFRLSRELHAAHEAADLLARTDALTGINNRRAFFDRGEQIVRYCERHGEALSVLLMDVDNFKSINDTLGHFVGDLVLQHVGSTLQASFRRSDVTGRIGGEEFAVLLPGTPGSEARAIAEKLRGTIAAEAIPAGERDLDITVSIGVASGGYDLVALLREADAAMYRAKAEGRNRVASCEDPARP